MKLFIGTSGYSYKHWANGVFYPVGLPTTKWLEYYGGCFNSVELNVTFYRLPPRTAFVGWDKKTPEDFRFTIKGSRYITHIKRLKDADDSLGYLEENTEPLWPKIECVLWQLPPSFKKNEERLENFCLSIKKQERLSQLRHVFEFRDNSWFCEKIYAILKYYHHIVCFAHEPQKIGEKIILGDFIYFRFHGGTDRYTSNYTESELSQWAEEIKGYAGHAQAVYVYFNNDAFGFAPQNAQLLREFLEE